MQGFLRRARAFTAWVTMAVALCAPLAEAEPTDRIQDTPEGTVKRLYHDYAWMAIGVDAFAHDWRTLEDQTLPELRKYFDPGFARLIRADWECRKKTGGICNGDRNLIFMADDTMAADLNIFPANKENQVQVTFKYPSDNESFQRQFDMIKTSHGWRIYDIHDLNDNVSMRAYLGYRR